MSRATQARRLRNRERLHEGWAIGWRCVSYLWCLVKMTGRKIDHRPQTSTSYGAMLFGALKCYEAELIRRLRKAGIDPSDVVQVEPRSRKRPRIVLKSMMKLEDRPASLENDRRAVSLADMAKPDRPIDLA